MSERERIQFWQFKLQALQQLRRKHGLPKRDRERKPTTRSERQDAGSRQRSTRGSIRYLGFPTYISAEMVDLMVTKNAYKANAKAFAMVSDLSKSTLDILA